MMTVISIVTAVSLALGVVSAGINFKTIYEIEMDRNYVAATEQQLAEQYKKVEEKLNDARRKNDTVSAAEYETILNSIRLVRDRSNVAMIGRQVEQRKAAFIDEQWTIFQANVAIGIVSWGMGKVGFGKVTDTYMQGNNWPPGRNFATWKPFTGQSERIILGAKPALIMAEFSDELADFMGAILNGFDVARSVTAPSNIQSALEASTYVSQELEENVRPLPKDIGDYLVASMIKRIKRENPQIATESFVNQAIFVRQQSCQGLNKMWLEESRDQTRSEALREAINKLECDKLAKPAAAVESSEKQEETTTLPKKPDYPVLVRDEEPLINFELTPLDASLGEHQKNYRVEESFFSLKDRYVSGGAVKHNLNIEVRFDIPPKMLEPGQEVSLTATFSGGGTLSTWPFDAEFKYNADNGTFSDEVPGQLTPWSRIGGYITPSSGYKFIPWDPSFSGPSSKTWVLKVPDDFKAIDTFEIWVYWGPCPACNVTWTYRLE